MQLVRIKDLLSDKISGEWGIEPKDTEGVCVIRTANFTNLGQINYEKVVIREIPENTVIKKRLQNGDLIIEKSGGSPKQPVGRIVEFYQPDERTYLCNNFTTILRPNNSKVHSKYLFYALLFNHRIGKTLRYQNKTTGIINLKLDKYLNSEIPIPEKLKDQIRIANILSRAEALIAKRKESIHLLDELLKSTFLDMFGDPVRNEKGFKVIKTIKDICQFKGGGTPSKSKPEYYTGDIPWVSPKDMKFLYISTSQDKITEQAIKESSTNLISKGAVLMVVRSGILKSKLPVAINNVDVTVNQDMKAFRSTEVLSQYLLYYFISNAKNILKKVRATTADNLNFDDIKSLKIIIPPLNLQTQFAQIVKKVENIKTKYQQSLQELENLYASLSQRAFKGELDLSKMEIEEYKLDGHAEHGRSMAAEEGVEYGKK